MNYLKTPITKVNKDITLKKDTQIGLFQVCEALEIVNDENDDTRNEDTLHNTNEEDALSRYICSVQKDLDLRDSPQAYQSLRLRTRVNSIVAKAQRSDYFAGGRLGQNNHIKTSDKTKTRYTTHIHSVIMTATFKACHSRQID